MKLLLKLFLILNIFSTLIFCQKLYICESYSQSGEPKGLINKLEIKPFGKAVYVILKSETKLNDKYLYLFVDKLSGNTFSPYDSKTLNIEKEAKWAVTSYEFRDSGIYELYFLNSAQKKLAVQKLEVTMVSESGSESINPNANFNLGHSKLVFCDIVIEDKPINSFKQFSLSNKNSEFYAYINNYVPFGTNKIIVKVYKRKNPVSNFDQIIFTKKFKLLPEWTNTFFKLNLDKIGDYKIDIEESNEKLIASNILSITN